MDLFVQAYFYAKNKNNTNFTDFLTSKNKTFLIKDANFEKENAGNCEILNTKSLLKPDHIKLNNEFTDSFVIFDTLPDVKKHFLGDQNFEGSIAYKTGKEFLQRSKKTENKNGTVKIRISTNFGQENVEETSSIGKAVKKYGKMIEILRKESDEQLAVMVHISKDTKKFCCVYLPVPCFDFTKGRLIHSEKNVVNTDENHETLNTSFDKNSMISFSSQKLVNFSKPVYDVLNSTKLVVLVTGENSITTEKMSIVNQLINSRFLTKLNSKKSDNSENDQKVEKKSQIERPDYLKIILSLETQLEMLLSENEKSDRKLEKEIASRKKIESKMEQKIVKFSTEIKSLKNENKELEKQVSHERKSWENVKAELESKVESLNSELRRSKLQGAMKNVLGDVKLSRIDLENKEKREREESERREAENIQNDKNRKIQTSILPDDYVETVRAKQWFETFNMNACHSVKKKFKTRLINRNRLFFSRI